MSKKKAAKAIKADVHEATQVEDIQVIDATKTVPAEVEVVGKEEDPMMKLVKIILPVSLRIKRKTYGPGPVIVPAHMVDTMVEMVDKKKRADISIFTGNNYLVQRMIDRSLVVSKVEKL